MAFILKQISYSGHYSL